MSRLGVTVFTLLSVLTSVAYAHAGLFGIAHLGSDGLSTLYHIDIVTGQATPIGSIGFERCGGMDFDTNGILFATCERADGSNTPVLITIDVESGVGREVGATGINGSISDISFRDSDNSLFAYDGISDPLHTLYTLNTITGQATLIGDTGLDFANGNGVTFDSRGKLIHSQTRGGIPRLYEINQATGEAVLIKVLMVDGPPQQVSYRLSALATQIRSGGIYGILNDSRGNSDIFLNYLAILDVESGVISIVGQTQDGMDAAAFMTDNIQSVPAISNAGLFITGILFFVLIILQVIRRYKRQSA